MNPDHAALIVIDMQRYFLDKNSHAYVPSSPAVLKNIAKLQSAFLAHNLTLIQTRHLNTENGARRMNQWWDDVITEDNHLSEIDNRLQCDRAVIVHKEQYDAFLDTNLEHILTKRGINQLVVTGVLTHLCCETTARSAFMRGFEVFFVIDGTATYSEEFHRAALLNLSHGFAVPMLTDEILKQLEPDIS
ncbi:MAG: isochorismatase family protein [Candidatus Zixiibacteriota bacterium]